MGFLVFGGFAAIIESPNRAAVTGTWAQREWKGAQRLEPTQSIDSALAFRESLISFVNHGKQHKRASPDLNAFCNSLPDRLEQDEEVAAAMAKDLSGFRDTLLRPIP